MKLDIKIYTDATELYTLLHRSYQTYLDSLDLSFNTEVRNLASSQHKEVIESAIATVNENVKNTDQKLLSKRDLTTSQKHSFLEELHEKAIAIYYGNENIVNLSCSSQVYRPLIICQCDSLPYLHCYIYIGNNRKKRKNGFCPLTSAHSAHEVNQKTIGILRPDILKSIYSPDWNKARSQAVGSYSSKNEKVQPVCSRCGTKADKLLPSAIVAAIRSRKDKGLDEIYRCRHCQAKEARTIAKKKRKRSQMTLSYWNNTLSTTKINQEAFLSLAVKNTSGHAPYAKKFIVPNQEDGTHSATAHAAAQEHPHQNNIYFTPSVSSLMRQNTKYFIATI